MVKDRIRKQIVETKRHLILQEVSRIFESEGFNAVKMQEIARRLGISVGALYKLFDSKDELYYAYIDFQIRRFHETLLRECPAAEDPRVCLECYIRMKFEVFTAKRKAIEDPVVGDPLFFLKMSAQRGDPAKPIFEYLARLFEKLHAVYPLRDSNFLRLAHLFNAFTTGHVEYWLHYGGRLEVPPAEVLSLFLKGVAF